MTPEKLYETDLHKPVKEFFEHLGYTIRSEVIDCDMTACRDDELIIVEMKLHLNLKLLLQATERQKYSELVYIAIPRPTRPSRQYRSALRLLKRLQLGLITVGFSRFKPLVRVELDPAEAPQTIRRRNTKARRGILAEIKGRSLDLNEGGSTRTPLVTAYRESAIFIATCLQAHGPQKTKDLRALGAGPKTSAILQANHYGWFIRVAFATYELTDQGRNDLSGYADIHALCLREIESKEQL